ncbi:SKP1-like protein 12 [Cornus florida]|uniref:SKP1-like protein 12 n=1 Tax=Cornus florida TaxID=4283 RepID=UPI00289D789D|nr:SKP1-like protein 12 [Cornus florida]
MLTLKSSDDEEFTVEESVAVQSLTIKNMIEKKNCSGTTTIPLPNVDSKTSVMLIQYCKKHADQSATADDIKKFDSEFVEQNQYALFDLVMAANYLNIKSLLHTMCDEFFISEPIDLPSAENMLTLRSSDNENFTVEDSVAVQSLTIKSMVENNCAGTTIPLPHADGRTLVTVIEYRKKHADQGATADEVEKFDSKNDTRRITLV